MAKALVRIRNLKKYFPIYGGIFRRQVASVHAVDGISLDIESGETMGLVGESGCGKTTVGRTLLRLVEPTGGEVFFEDRDVFKMSEAEIRDFRRECQIIFQDPFSSLNPRMTVGDIVGAPLKVHNLANRRERRKIVQQLLERVGLDPYDHISRYPHEFSGGQRQRIAIARALALNPKFIIADEPVSSLDISVRAQVLNLMRELQEMYGLTYLFISHDLSVVRYLCDRVAVMYLGKLVELAPFKDLFENPLHPYTEALLSAVPVPDPTVKRETIILKGEVPTPINPPQGCRFHTRCPEAKPVCTQAEPEFTAIESSDRHFVACHFR